MKGFIAFCLVVMILCLWGIYVAIVGPSHNSGFSFSLPEPKAAKVGRKH